ncbi:eukaryotic translation elongation factor 1 epsilon-1 [Salvelinus sp. IW2-2015]|uniref:eukaryotic translation elongation factor 1 epsilon-1 n=1 Tax=Salvelinus sp. IW2-2015 TaxID=2691554 RepID=UPI000CDF6FE6|nr:eukaryotic translation elongation factor 1 epsilon-1 isoform X1 [Salvelinus alpinus]
MMALRELSSLEKSLGLKKPNKYSTQGDKKVPVLHSNNGPALVGLVTIATHLVQEAKRPELLGESAEHKAVVQQWLEYRLTKVDGCHKDNIKTILKDLNSYLEDKVYLAGNEFTLADTLMYYGIHHIIVDLAIQEKEKHMNVTRWFDHVQHHTGVRHHLPPVVVLRNRVYTSSHH